MVDVARLIKELALARTELAEAVSAVDRQREICPGWTVKEMLAHITGWDAVGISSIRAHVAGEQPPPLQVRDIDAYNAYVVAGSETLSFQEVVEDWERTRGRLEVALRDAPPEKLGDEIHLPWGATGSIAWYMSILVEHEREHAQEIMGIVSANAGEATE